MSLEYPKLFPAVFAYNGDSTEDIPVVPETLGTGNVSYQLGFPPETSLPLPPKGDGKSVSRSDMNALFKQITQMLMFVQSGGLFSYDSSLSYKAYQSIVLHDGIIYICIKDLDAGIEATPGVDKLSWQTLISYLQQSSASQVGNIIIRPVMKLPANAILCNGAEVAINDYPLLYNELGTESSEGCQPGFFKVPDLRGYFLRFLDMGRGVDSEPDRSVMSYQEDASRAITGQLGQLNNYAGLIGAQQGAFSSAKWGTSIGIKSTTGADNYISVDFDSSRVVPTASENRSKNVALVAAIIFE